MYDFSMMAKLFYIGCIFLLIQNNVFGQVAHATITVTISTPVGAEISNSINFENFYKIRTTSVNNNLIQQEQNETQPFLKVIGESFAYNVTIENDLVLLKRKKGLKEFQPTEKYQPSLNITVNFN